MSLVDEVDVKCDENGKNNLKIHCQSCPSIMLNKGSTTLIAQKFALPHMRPKSQEEATETEMIDQYWLANDVYTFENVTVTKFNPVDKTKYLACADCEIGPIGYIDTSTNKCYVATSRVMYKEAV